ncbi:MAG: polyprenyl synthetase family protein [Treponema sp.]|nr:polyprenyl synthetase family protein [Treponema sp.]
MNIEYSQRLEKIEDELDKWLPRRADSPWLDKVFGGLAGIGESAVHPELAQSLILPGRDLVDRGGKRWRPLLMLLTAEALAGTHGAETALPLTPLIELPHNASLIHDDIEDNSDERRGKPAVHLIYGTDTAINGGAFMYFLPLACLDSTNLEYVLKTRLWSAWSTHLRALHLGQAMDIAWHRDFRSLPGLNEYDRMCRLKTGCLARLAAVLGVICAGGNEACASEFGRAAEQLGVGFQILDDVKNLTVGIPGKKRGDDIVEGKKSLPVLLYLHRYPEKRDFAADCFTVARSTGVNAPEVNEIIDVMKDAGVLEEAAEKANFYINESREILSSPKIPGHSFNKEGLRLLAGLVDILL